MSATKLYLPCVNSHRLRDFVFLGALLLSGPSRATQDQGAGGSLEPAIREQMAGKAGAVVVLDVSSGKIAASFNLKTASQRVTAPGSTLKPFVMLELLEHGKVDSEQRMVCRRRLTLV